MALVFHLLLFLSPQPKPVAVVQTTSQNTFLFLEPHKAEASNVTSLWLDPTVYLLPADLGFSSPLRKREPESRHMPMKTEIADHTMPFEPTRMENASEAEDSTLLNAINTESMVLRQEPNSDDVDKSMDAGSAWLVSNNLSRRLLPSSTTLPLVVSSELLGPTSIRVCVGSNGAVLYAVLEKTSGLESADDAALKFAKALRFQNDLNGATEWGMLKVFWHADIGTTIKS